MRNGMKEVQLKYTTIKLYKQNILLLQFKNSLGDRDKGFLDKTLL